MTSASRRLANSGEPVEVVEMISVNPVSGIRYYPVCGGTACTRGYRWRVGRSGGRKTGEVGGLLATCRLRRRLTSY